MDYQNYSEPSSELLSIPAAVFLLYEVLPNIVVSAIMDMFGMIGEMSFQDSIIILNFDNSGGNDTQPLLSLYV